MGIVAWLRVDKNCDSGVGKSRHLTVHSEYEMLSFARSYKQIRNLEILFSKNS